MGNSFSLDAFGFAVGGHQEDLAFGRQDLRADDFVLVIQLDAVHARRDESHRAHIIFLEADRHALRGDEQDILPLAVGQTDPISTVAFVDFGEHERLREGPGQFA